MSETNVGANLMFALRTKTANEPISKKQCIWVHGLPSPSVIGLISVSVRGRTQGSPLHWFRTLVGFRFLFEATFSPNLYIRPFRVDRSKYFVICLVGRILCSTSNKNRNQTYVINQCRGEPYVRLRTKTGIKPMFENELETFASDIGSQTIVVRRANTRFAPTLVSDKGMLGK